MNGMERFEKTLRCEEVDKLPCHWHGPEPAGLYIKEFNVYIDSDEAESALNECYELNPVLGDITISNWYSRGTSTDKGMASGKNP